MPSTKWRGATELGKAAALDLHRDIAFPVPMHKEIAFLCTPAPKEPIPSQLRFHFVPSVYAKSFTE
jgi:hypothetical protein